MTGKRPKTNEQKVTKKVASSEQKVTRNEQEVANNKHKVGSNEQNVTSNKQKVTSNEQKVKSIEYLALIIPDPSLKFGNTQLNTIKTEIEQLQWKE